MKRFRILTLLLAFMLATPTLLHAQIVKGELILGGNISQVDGDECYHYRKPGVHVGAGALVPLTSWMWDWKYYSTKKVLTKVTPSTSILAFIQEPTN